MWGRKHFYFAENISVGVKDLGQAVTWYPLKSEDFEAFLAFAKDDDTGLALVVIPSGETKANIPGHPILFTKQIEAAYEDFVAKGINVQPIQNDSGGNRFFRFQDLEGNEVEVCAEP